MRQKLAFTFSILFAFTCFNLIFCLQFSEKSVSIDPGDEAALIAVKKGLLDSYGILNWVGSKPCDWFGITCSTDGRVTDISLDSNYLGGSLSPRLGNLSHLQKLVLSNNQISGDFPAEIYNLVKLEHLDLSLNQIQGRFSSGIKNLRNLKYLSVSSNSFTGSIPSQISNLTRLEHLALDYNLISGQIPPEIQSLQNLKSFSVESNNLTGNIPTGLSKLTSLEHLKLGSNAFSGELPPEFGELTHLKELSVNFNRLSGSIPSELGNLKNLTALHLNDNQFTGSIPTALKKTSLIDLFLSNNLLQGTIPSDLFVSLCPGLSYLDLDGNNLTGTIPSEISLCTYFDDLSLSYNQLEGSIPNGINATSFKASDNKLEGSIPTSMYESPTLKTLDLSNNNLKGDLLPFNCNSLREINIGGNAITGNLSLSRYLFHCPRLITANLSSNDFYGSFPPSPPLLSPLETLSLRSNRLSGEIGSEISKFTNMTTLILSENTFNGSLPVELSKLSSISTLDLSSNRFSGTIPSFLFLSFPSLIYIDLSNNQFNGSIPLQLCSLNDNFSFLSLSNNRISGSIPFSIGSCDRLNSLNLASNFLSSSIPSSFQSLSELISLNLSHNSFNGSFPSSTFNMSNLNSMDLSHNQFKGSIPNRFDSFSTNMETLKLNNNLFNGSLPSQISKLTLLSLLDLSSNSLHGSIPSNLFLLSNLKYLNISNNGVNASLSEDMFTSNDIETIDLSHNSLQGTIPSSLGFLEHLHSLSLSFNSLQGRIPPSLKDKFPKESFIGNPLLCGYPIDSPCPSDSRNSPFPFILTGIVGCILFLFAFIVGFFMWRRRYGMQRRGGLLLFGDVGMSLGVDDVYTSTSNFDKGHLLGKGGFGEVYWGELPGSNIKLAIKKMIRGSEQGEGEFLSEINLLGKIRHRNLVSLLAAYVDPIEGHRWLIYEFMENGSLELLFEPSLEVWHPLNFWKVRLGIAFGIAKGLTYLHHQSRPPIIHRDLKPGNVLLDREFRAYISDFGLARPLDAKATHFSTRAFGTVGYMSMEYARKGRATTKSDMYAYGIILLQLVTGKRPTDEQFAFETLRQWVEGHVMEDVLDKRLNDAKEYQASIVAMLELGLVCTSVKPNERPLASSVLLVLEKMMHMVEV